MTLTYKLDLDILSLDLHAVIQVRVSVRSAVTVVTHRQTDTHTDTQTHDVKTITPITSETWGVKIPAKCKLNKDIPVQFEKSLYSASP